MSPTIPSRAAGLIILVVVATTVRGQGNPHRDVPIEDLVRASGGRLAVYARNLSDPTRELALNAVGERQVGDLSRVLVAAAVLAHVRATGTSLDVALPYPADGFRGAGGVLADRHEETFTLDRLLAASVRDADPAATDLLIGWLGAALPSFVTGLNIDGLRPVSSHGERDRFVLERVDPRFDQVPMAAAQRWLRDGDAGGIVPQPFPSDPRRRDDHVRVIGEAWQSWYRERRDAAPLRAVADAWTAILRGRGLHSDDRVTLVGLLRGVPRVACARDLGLHLGVAGCDSSSWRRRSSAALVETRKGTVVVITHARGFGSDAEAAHLQSRLGEAAVRRLAPGGWRPDPDPLPKTLPRSIRSATLLDASGGQRTDFDVGDEARLALRTAATAETTVVVRWMKSDGTCLREARALSAGTFATEVFSLPLTRAGRYRVELSLGRRLIHRTAFQVRQAGG